MRIFISVALWCIGWMGYAQLLYMHENGKADNFGNPFLNSKVVHPDEVIYQEMTKREVKKLKQGKLTH